MDASTERLLLAFLGIAGAIAAGAVARGQERRIKRDEERRAWALEFRRLVVGMRNATVNLEKRVVVVPSLLAAEGSNPNVAAEAAWNLWVKDVAPIEQNFFAYLELVAFMDIDLRRRLADAYTALERAANSRSLEGMAHGASRYVELFDEVRLRIDRELKISTAMTEMQAGASPKGSVPKRASRR